MDDSLPTHYPEGLTLRPTQGLAVVYLLYAVAIGLPLAVGGMVLVHLGIDYGYAAFPLLLGMASMFIIRYLTLQYTFEPLGLRSRWGWLNKRESYLTYARIQDIHVSRNLIERLVGIGTIAIQTASGSAWAEERVVGLTHVDRLRDYLYGKVQQAYDRPNVRLLEDIHALLEALHVKLAAERDGPC